MTDEKNTPESADFTPPAETTGPVIDEAPASDDPDTTFDSVAEAFAAMTDGPDGVDESAPPQYGVGPFSIREVTLGGVWLLAFIVSFFPIYGQVGAGVSVWSGGIDWILTIGVPTVAVFLLLLRRLSPQGIRRVGSLGIDQFASVAFTVSAVIWLGILWSSFVTLFNSRLFVATWVVWVEFILMLAGVLLTVFAPLLPTVGEDFRHRTEVPAHRFASPARPIVARPQTERPVPADLSPYAGVATAAPAATDSFVADDTFAPEYETAEVARTVEADPSPAASQAFWALAPEEREVVDETGTPLFTIGPTAWALVIEDRGDSYVVRHEDGRIGYLTDTSDVTRG